jgi:non-specific serine/threonine protein kinase
LFFISLKAGGTGLNLTSASYVIILDPWWNPFAELQAIGRAHRIGQKQNVNVVRFIAKETIEEKINTLQQTKRDLADSVIESQITSEVMLNLDAILE